MGALRTPSGDPVDVLGCDNAGGSLDALEVDAGAAVAKLGEAIKAFDLTTAATEVGPTPVKHLDSINFRHAV